MIVFLMIAGLGVLALLEDALYLSNQRNDPRQDYQTKEDKENNITQALVRLIPTTPKCIHSDHIQQRNRQAKYGGQLENDRDAEHCYAQKNDRHTKSLLSVLDTALCYHSRADHTRGCMPILKKELIYWRYASTRKCATIRKVCFWTVTAAVFICPVGGGRGGKCLFWAAPRAGEWRDRLGLHSGRVSICPGRFFPVQRHDSGTIFIGFFSLGISHPKTACVQIGKYVRKTDGTLICEGGVES